MKISPKSGPRYHKTQAFVTFGALPKGFTTALLLFGWRRPLILGFDKGTNDSSTKMARTAVRWRCYFDRSVNSDNMYAMEGRTSSTGMRSLSPWANRSLSFMKSGLTP
jgi:hypothetical protein